MLDSKDILKLEFFIVFILMGYKVDIGGKMINE